MPNGCRAIGSQYEIGSPTAEILGRLSQMRWVLLCALVLACSCRVERNRIIEPVMSNASPLLQMMEKVSLSEFEKAVLAHPQWVNQKSTLPSNVLPDMNNTSVLVAAALTDRTNHVRVLIANGADVMEALDWCKRNQIAPDCTNLILDVCREMGKAVAPRR